MKRFRIILFFILLTHLDFYAQSSVGLGLLPSLNINKRLQKDWSLNFKAESRQSLRNKVFYYDYLLTDISLAASKKIGINTAIAMGYLLRTDNKDVKNRMFQQITFVKRHSNFRLAHRLLTDQTYDKIEPAEFRLRYRISTEIPVQGKSLDPKEFYIKLNHEYLNSLNNRSYDLEIRGAPFIGYVISPTNKIEFGFDFRMDSFLNSNLRSRLWIGINLFKSI